MQLINKNGIVLSKIRKGSNVVFQDNYIKITSSAMRDIIEDMSKSGFESASQKIKENGIPFTQGLEEDLKLRFRLLHKNRIN